MGTFSIQHCGETLFSREMDVPPIVKYGNEVLTDQSLAGSVRLKTKQTWINAPINLVEIGKGEDIELDLTTYPVSKEGATYGFSYDATYGLSNENKGVNNSFAYGKLTFTLEVAGNVTMTVWQVGESGYDYGQVSELDATFYQSIVPETSNVKWDGRSAGTTTYDIVYENVPAGTHFITFKYRHDSSTIVQPDVFAIKAFKIPGPGADIKIASLLTQNEWSKDNILVDFHIPPPPPKWHFQVSKASMRLPYETSVSEFNAYQQYSYDDGVTRTKIPQHGTTYWNVETQDFDVPDGVTKIKIRLYSYVYNSNTRECKIYLDDVLVAQNRDRDGASASYEFYMDVGDTLEFYNQVLSASYDTNTWVQYYRIVHNS